MTGRERFYFWGGIVVMTVAMLGLMAAGVRGAESTRPAAAQLYAAPQLEQVIAASCKVSVDLGGGERAGGSGCLYGYETAGRVRRGVVITAAHVLRGAGKAAVVTLRFGRRLVRVPARIVWTSAATDAAAVAFDVGDWPAGETMPRAVPFVDVDWNVPEGQAVFTLGYPAGAQDIRLLSARARRYEPDGTLRIHPGPELGRSGSAVVTVGPHGQPVIVGIVSTRTSGGMRADTEGRLVTPRMIWRSERQTQRTGWQETATADWRCRECASVLMLKKLPGGPSVLECWNNHCSLHLKPVDPWQQTGDMLMSVGIEAQCPPGQPCPVHGPGAQTVPKPADLYRVMPYRQKNDERIGQMQQNIQRLDDQAERSPGTIPLPPMFDAAPLAQRVDELERAVNAQAQRLGELGETERKAKELAEAVSKRDESFAKDLAAVRGEATDAKKAVEEATDEENPKGPLGRLKARLEERVEGVKEKVGGVFGLPTFLGGAGLGLGGFAIVIALVALFTRRQLRERRETGDPTPGERVLRGAETVAATIPGERLDTVLKFMREFYERQLERIAPRPPAPPAA